MADRIEPPILMSRLMTFVFASSLVVMGVLLLTLYNMFPLNRPQVFFLFTQPSGNRNVSLAEMNVIQDKEDRFIRAFIMEYIKARNEVVTNSTSMHKKWNNDTTGIVHAWSTDEVYEKFINTTMYTAMMNETTLVEFECPVEFEGPVKPYKDKENMYDVSFRYFCKNSDGQDKGKSYTVRITLDKDYQSKAKWTDRLVNPLGIRVSGYQVISGDDDPLNMFMAQ